MLETKRLILRKWTEADDADLFEYAKDPDVGPIAGWPPHKSVEESRNVIKNVLNGAECYAVCEKGSNTAIGAIELILKPFWGRGYIPEAAAELIRRGFEDLGMTTVWCRYFDGNQKSKRVQEKLGFVFHHTDSEVPVPLLDEVRTDHTNILTKERWEKMK